MLANLVAHNLELGHHSTIIESSHAEVGHELLGDMLSHGKRLEIGIEELLVLLRSQSIDVIELLDCVTFGIYQHADVQDLDDRGTFRDLNPSERDRLHDWHDIVFFVIYHDRWFMGSRCNASLI